jgi:translation initiation factor 2 subunit 3
LSAQKLAEPGDGMAPLPRQPEVNIGTAGHVDHGKCLRWDQYVVVNGMPLTGPEIEALVKQRGRLLGRVDGGEVYEFGDSDVVSIDASFQPRTSKSLFFVQPYHGPIHSIRTSTGRTLAVTPEHPLLVNRGGRMIWVKSKDLAMGDHLSFLSEVPPNEGLEFREPREAMSSYYTLVSWSDYEHLRRATNEFSNFSALPPAAFDKLRILAGLSNEELCRRLRVDRKTWKRALDGWTPPRSGILAKLRRFFAAIDLVGLAPGEFLAVRITGGARHIRRLKEFELDDDLAKWFAFVWSEGTSGRNHVGVTQTLEMKMLDEYLRITKEKLGQRVSSYGGGGYVIHNGAFVDYLRLKFGYIPGNKYESPVLPWICRASRNQRRTFLRWFFTLDGEFNRKSGRISISQANTKSIVVLGYLLASFGIIPRFGEVRRRVKGGTRTYDRLTISGRRSMRLFSSNIGFESVRKQRALDQYLARSTDGGKESNLGIPLDAPSLAALMRKSGLIREGFGVSHRLQSVRDPDWYQAYESLRRTGTTSRRKLLSIVQSIQSQVDLVNDSATTLSKEPERLLSHMSLLGMSQAEAANGQGMSRRKLVRIVRRGGRSEKNAVIDYVLKRSFEALREVQASLEQLKNLSSTPLEFDRIKKIDVEEYDGKVFDLTVPAIGNFVAGNGALVSHNSTLTQAITGVWTSAHSEELKRGITIKVGYADAAFYRCPHTPAPASYSTSPKCPVCGRDTKLLRAVSFVDCPGHESLMTNMLAGAFLMDGALLLIAANEPVPKPQTREHLQALHMLGMKKIVIAQNKVDLVTEAEAKKNHSQIEKFVKNTVAADAPIVPISAQQKLNIDALIEAIEEYIPTPKRDPRADSLMYVVRSFDVNRPGLEVSELSGGVLGGSLTKGELRVGDEIEMKPGMPDERSGRYVPVVTKILGLQTGAGEAEKVGPGGLVAVGTYLDPTFTRGDQMVGSVIGKPGTLPPSWEHVTLDVELLETAVGSAELVKVDKVKLGETVRLNLGTASTLASVTSARGDVIEVDLKKPVAVEVGMRAAISRRIAERWRLIGSGVLR